MLMSVSIPYIAKDFGLSFLAMGVVLSAFFGAYSVGQIPGGILADKYGGRNVASIAIVWWSIFTAVTGMVSNLTQMAMCQVIFGLGEALYPGASFKLLSAWFSSKERGTAMGIRLSANSLGGAMCPIIAVGIMSVLGWRWGFYLLSLLGIVSIILWRAFITDTPAQDNKVSAQELALIQGDDIQRKTDEQKIAMGTLMKKPIMWGFFAVYFGFDITLWGFHSWVPSFLVKGRGFSMLRMGVGASLPFWGGMIGCILGGWMSDKYFKDKRRIPIIGSQLLSAAFLYLTITAHSPTMIIVWLSLAGTSIQFFASSFWAFPYSVIPTSIMGSAGAFINFAGQAAAFVAPMMMGYLVHIAGGRFFPAFSLLIGAALFSSLMTFTIKNAKREFAVE
jgi:sugar phosphate permease